MDAAMAKPITICVAIRSPEPSTAAQSVKEESEQKCESDIDYSEAIPATFLGIGFLSVVVYVVILIFPDLLAECASGLVQTVRTSRV